MGKGHGRGGGGGGRGGEDFLPLSFSLPMKAAVATSASESVGRLTPQKGEEERVTRGGD